MEDYRPSPFTGFVDGNLRMRSNQEIWNLVGLDPVILKVHELIELFKTCGLPIDAKISYAQSNVTGKVLAPLEEGLYDRLNEIHEPPSERNKYFLT